MSDCFLRDLCSFRWCLRRVWLCAFVVGSIRFEVLCMWNMYLCVKYHNTTYDILTTHYLEFGFRDWKQRTKSLSNNSFRTTLLPKHLSFYNTQYLQNSRSWGTIYILTIGSLCLLCCERDTAWSWLKLNFIYLYCKVLLPKSLKYFKNSFTTYYKSL